MDRADIMKALKGRPLQLLPFRVRSFPVQPTIPIPPIPMPTVGPEGASELATPLKGYVLAWRQWGIVSHRDGTFRLMSFHGGAIWPARAKLVAACLGNPFSPHLPPEPSCTCGIYALKNGTVFRHPFWLASAARQDSTKSISWTVGKVALWGRVLEGEQGFRGQYAYPYALWSAGLTKHERVALGDVYGVHVNPIDRHALKEISDGGYEFVE